MSRFVRDERGAVGGFEALPFGFLIFVAGTLLLANAWSVIDATLAVSAAAREAARAYVESVGPADAALTSARLASDEALSGHGRDTGRARLSWEGPLRFERCARVTFVAHYRVPVLSVPWIGAFGSGLVETSARHSEVVDPFRNGPVAAGDDLGGPCG